MRIPRHTALGVAGLGLMVLWIGIWGFLAHRAAGLGETRPQVWVYVVGENGQVYGPAAVPAGTPARHLLQRLGVDPKGVLRLNGEPWDATWPLPKARALVLEVRTFPQRPHLEDRVSVGRYPPAWIRTYSLASAAPFRAKPARIQVGKATTTLPADASFVGEALAQYGLAPQYLDRLSLEETQPWPPQQPLTWIHQEERIEIRRETVPYTVEYQALPDEPIDTLRVVHPGTQGLQARVELVQYENGRETGRVPLGTWVLQEPHPRVVGYGTKITIQTLETPDGPIRYWRAVRVYATSYSPCRVHPGGPCDDITASGRRLQKGIVAVRLAWYRYMKGMRVYIPGYGFGIIADVGGGIPGRPWVDLGYSDADYQPWHRWVTMYFLAPPPPPEQILWILP